MSSLAFTTASVNTPPPVDYAKLSRDDLLSIIETQRRALEDTRQALAWRDALMSNAALPISTRLTAYGLRRFLETKRLPTTAAAADQEYKVYLPAVGELAGISGSTVSRGLEQLDQAVGAVTKRTQHEYDALNNKKSLTYLQVHDSFQHPAELAPVKDIKRHGGDHRIARCPSCQSTQIVEKRIQVCAECGEVYQEFEPRLVNEPVEPAEGEPLQDATAIDSENEEPVMVVESTIEEPLHLATAMPADGGEPLLSASLYTHKRVGLQELQARRIWVVWRYGPDANGRPTKVPYIADRVRSPQRAKSNDPSTWRSFEQAQRLYEQSRDEGWARPFAGVGLMCDGSFTGIDLDHCIDPETGVLTDQAAEIVRRFASYTYITPSLEGLRILVWGAIPAGRKLPHIELYSNGRFFTWRDDQWSGTPDTIEDRQAELDALYGELTPAPLAVMPSTRPKASVTSCSTGRIPDEVILAKARSARNAGKFCKLFDRGDISDYRKATGEPDASRADQALCAMLAYWTDGDVEAIDRLFRQSALMRPKWERQDYRDSTIEHGAALAGYAVEEAS